MEDVLLGFGEPQEHFDAPTVFLYRWIRVKGVFLVAVGAKGAGGGTSYPPEGWAGDSETVEYTLHILFDQQDRVSRYDVSTVVLRRDQHRPFPLWR